MKARGEPTAVGSSFLFGWTIFRLTVWATVAVWVNPRLLGLIGGEGIARWLMDHRWVHTLSGLPIGLLALISVLEVLNDPRKHAARQALAGSVGGTLVKLRGIDPTFGIPDGPGLRVPLGRWSMVVGTWKSKSDTRTVATVRLETRSSFSFLARGTDREPEMMRGLQQLAAGRSLRDSAEQPDDSRVAMATATFAYLSEAPVATGVSSLDRAIVLRTNQPDTARALFTASALASAIAALNERTPRWDWSLYPAETAGTAEMRLECPGSLKDADTLKAMQALMATALDEMTRAETIAA